jgi:hypothetical protein
MEIFNELYLNTHEDPEIKEKRVKNYRRFQECQDPEHPDH